RLDEQRQVILRDKVTRYAASEILLPFHPQPHQMAAIARQMQGAKGRWVDRRIQHNGVAPEAVVKGEFHGKPWKIPVFSSVVSQNCLPRSPQPRTAMIKPLPIFLREIDDAAWIVHSSATDYPDGWVIEPHSHNKDQLIHAIEGVMVVYT